MTHRHFVNSGLAGALLISMLAGSAAAQLRVAAWNISFYDGTDRASDIQTAVYSAFSGRSFSPDVLAVQEIQSASALSTLVNVLNTAPGSPGDWASSGYISGPDSQSLVVFRTSKVQFVRLLEIAAGSSNTSDQPRNTYRCDLRLRGYADAPANYLAVYSVHLKAGSASSDNDRRLVETTHIRQNAQGVDTFGPGSAMPAGYNFVVAGDYNMQSSTQTSYAELVSSQANNAGRVFDPINSPGTWNNNGTFRYIHTQDPTGSGGMDDRHDQILVSASLIDGVGFDYIGSPAVPFSTTTWNDPNHSYRCWGNDGTSFNLALTTTGNTMVGPTIAQALKNAATTAGGHLPVYLDLRVPAKISADTVLDFGTVTQGSTAPSRTLTVSNAGDVALWSAAGIANLSYSLPSVAGFTVPVGAYADAPGGGVNTHAISMPTSTVGVKNTTLVISSNDPDQPSRVVQLIGEVVSGVNQPPIADAGPDITVTDADGSGVELVHLDASASYDPDGTITIYRWSEGATVLATGSIPTASVNFTVGTHTVQLMVTDNNNATATDTLIVTVDPQPAACNPDYNQDGSADNSDVVDLANDVASGTQSFPGSDPDFNADGAVDFSDVIDLVNVIAGGNCP